MTEPTPLEATILRLTAACGADKSVSPIDVARAFDADEGEAWRRHLTAIRKAALRLAAAGHIEILRKGKPVPAEDVRGVIRLRACAERVT